MSGFKLDDAPETTGGGRVFNDNVAGRATGCIVTVKRTTPDEKTKNPKLPDYSLVLTKKEDAASTDAPYVSFGLYKYSAEGRTDASKDIAKLGKTLRHIWEVCTGKPASAFPATNDINDAMVGILKTVDQMSKTSPIVVNCFLNFGGTNTPAKQYVQLRKFPPFIEPGDTPADKTLLKASKIEHFTAGVPDERSGGAATEGAASGGFDSPAAGAGGISAEDTAGW